MPILLEEESRKVEGRRKDHSFNQKEEVTKVRDWPVCLGCHTDLLENAILERQRCTQVPLNGVGLP